MHLVKCDQCGKVQEAPVNADGYPSNPTNPETGDRWWSRVVDGKAEHVCSRACRYGRGGALLLW